MLLLGCDYAALLFSFGDVLRIDTLYEVVFANHVLVAFADSVLNETQIFVCESKGTFVVNPLGESVGVEVANTHGVDVFEDAFAV